MRFRIPSRRIHLERKPKSRLRFVLGSISPWHSHLKRLYHVPPELSVAYRQSTITSDDRILFVQNQKVGSSSTNAILTAYQEYIGEPVDAIERGINGWERYERALQRPDTAVIGVCRHPEKRCVSAFANFFLDLSHPSTSDHLKSMQARGFHPSLPAAQNFDAFLTLIEDAMALDPLRVDRHWRPQTINLGYGFIPYSRVCRLENYSEDVSAVLTEKGLGDFAASLDLSIPLYPSRARFQISDKQRDRIRRIYAQDYEAFGYV